MPGGEMLGGGGGIKVLAGGEGQIERPITIDQDQDVQQQQQKEKEGDEDEEVDMEKIKVEIGNMEGGKDGNSAE